MINMGIIVLNIGLLSMVLLFLHRQTQRWGFAPLLVVLGGITGIIQERTGIYVALAPAIRLFITSNVIVPNVLMIILVLYIANGSIPARMGIYSVLLVSLVVLALQITLQVYRSLPDGGSTTGLTQANLGYNAHITFASMVAFAADMFVIAIAYQGTHNLAVKLPEWVIVGIALFIGMWTDSIVFSLLSSADVNEFAASIPGDVIGKTLSAAVLWLPAAYYIVRVAPKSADYIGTTKRPTLDLFMGSLQQIVLAMVRVESALVESEAKRRQEAVYFRQISENINEALWLTSGDEAKILYVNARYEYIWGREAAAFYNSSAVFLESIHPDDRQRVQQYLPRHKTMPQTLEYRIIRPDGSIRWLRDRAFPIKGDDGQIAEIAGITEDITEQRLLEEQQIALKVAQEKVKFLREFIAEATHDLKTPLTSLNLKIYRLNQTANEDDRKRLTVELKALTGHLDKMIEDILTLSRLDSVSEMQIAPFDLNDDIHKHCVLMQPVIEDKALTLIFDLTDSQLPLQADPDDLSRAIGNLIENAIHYSQQDGMVTIRTRIVDREAIFTIIDTGIGIPPADQPHIFERFYRALNARAADISGTGLGLAIVKKIIDQHHGHLEFTSVEHHGTTFSIHLPVGQLE